MWMVQMTIDEVVHMIAVRHCFVTATRAMYMPWFMAAAYVLGGARVWVRSRDGNDVFVNVIAVRMVQMTIVQIVDVPFVNHGDMATVRAVLMVMVLVVGLVTSCHGNLLKIKRWGKNHAAGSAAWVRMLSKRLRTCSSASA